MYRRRRNLARRDLKKKRLSAAGVGTSTGLLPVYHLSGSANATLHGPGG
jgi:hypothetical protein